MTYEEYTTRLNKLRIIWKSKEAAPPKSTPAYKLWDTDMELTVRKSCIELFNE